MYPCGWCSAIYFSFFLSHMRLFSTFYVRKHTKYRIVSNTHTRKKNFNVKWTNEKWKKKITEITANSIRQAGSKIPVQNCKFKRIKAANNNGNKHTSKGKLIIKRIKKAKWKKNQQCMGFFLLFLFFFFLFYLSLLL